MTWTFEKQRILDQLQAEKESHDAQLRIAVKEVVDEIYFYNMAEDRLLQELIDHADELIEVLVPFTNGKWSRS